MEKLLDKIDSPQDLKRLSQFELFQLAAEIRDEIIRTVSRTGGHLASSLGVVELTLAIHYVFNCPEDRIIWDVGHQAYAHKLITGRRDQFSTLRQLGGISGFPRRDESPYDCFTVGHSGTSISALVGMMEGSHLKGQPARTIAVIGDGSLTAGIAFEGLNQAGHLGKNLIVILNDNEMSISPNVGALSAHLSSLMTGGTFLKIRRRVKDYISSMPRRGDILVQAIKRTEELFKGFLMPGVFFEELGFKYFGPLRGHNLPELIQNLENIKNIEGPVLVHVITRKGKGYLPAETNPEAFHGIGPFCVETGKPLANGSGGPSFTQVFAQALVKLATMDQRIVAITAAMPQGTGLDKFQEAFPRRFYDVGIAEQHAVTFAAGLASEGLRPVAAIYSTFLQRAYDQIVHDVGIPNLPVIFAVDRSGIVGEDGPTHQGAFDLSFLRHIPNLALMAPKDANELQHMLFTALRYAGPAAIRYPRGSSVPVRLDAKFKRLPWGKAETLTSGDDLAILAVGPLVYAALEAARQLEKSGWRITVVNSRFIKPLDRELILQLARRCAGILTVEENVLMGGFGSAVLELLEAEGVDKIKIRRVGLPDGFIEHGAPQALRRRYGLDTAGILQAAATILAPRKPKRKD